jgi:hypothetical protein
MAFYIIWAPPVNSITESAELLTLLRYDSRT